MITETQCRDLLKKVFGHPTFSKKFSNSTGSGIIVPNLKIWEDPRINAFAGVDKDNIEFVEVSRGLLSRCNEGGCFFVLAHEAVHLDYEDYIERRGTAYFIQGCFLSLGSLFLLLITHSKTVFLTSLFFSYIYILYQRYNLCQQHEYRADIEAASIVGWDHAEQVLTLIDNDTERMFSFCGLLLLISNKIPPLKRLLESKTAKRIRTLTTSKPAVILSKITGIHYLLRLIRHLVIVFTTAFQTHPPVADRKKKLQEKRREFEKRMEIRA